MWRRAVPLAVVALVSACGATSRASLGPVEAIAAQAPAVPTVAAPRVGVVRSAALAKAPIRIAFGGDVHGEPPIRQLLARGEDPLAGVHAALSDADAVMVNLETAVSDKGEALPREFSFNAPSSLLPALKSGGVTVVNLANNHSGDFGTVALVDTIERAAAAGLVVVGAGRDANEAYTAKVLDVRGVRIAFLGFGRNIPTDAAIAGEHSAGQADGRNAQFAASVVARARAAADAVVVMVHTGVEREVCPTASDRAFFDALHAAGATIVVGNHPHVLQGIVEADGQLSMYSNGNFVFYPTTDDQRRTGVLTVGLDQRGKVIGYDFAPAVIDAEGRPQLVSGAIASQIMADVAARRPGAGVC